MRLGRRRGAPLPDSQPEADAGEQAPAEPAEAPEPTQPGPTEPAGPTGSDGGEDANDDGGEARPAEGPAHEEGDAAGVRELPDDVVTAPRRRGWWRRMSGRMGSGIRGALRIRGSLDDGFYDDVLEALISADCGVDTSQRLVDELRERVRSEHISDGEAAMAALKSMLLDLLGQRDRTLRLHDVPSILLMVGVNGSGKTTTTGKLAYRLREEGRVPLVAAADTYRAAAIDQMRIWGNRAGVDVVAHQPGGDPGAVVYDAIQAALARRVDVVLVDTAGRLHTKTNLMAELQKVRRVAERLIPEAPQETLLVLDASTGMNALSQGRAFHDAVALTGLVLTKLDGSARGGTVIALEQELGVPVKLVGIGEGIDDLNVFDAEAYVDALFGDGAGAGEEEPGEG